MLHLSQNPKGPIACMHTALIIRPKHNFAEACWQMDIPSGSEAVLGLQPGSTVARTDAGPVSQRFAFCLEGHRSRRGRGTGGSETAVAEQ